MIGVFALAILSFSIDAKTVAERVTETKPAFERELMPALKKAGIAGLPTRVALLYMKNARTLNLYAAGDEGDLKLIKKYPVKAASGKAGPKLLSGDLQVPEGIYSVESLNPNSAFYLSLRVNYPNAIDRKRAAAEGRSRLGGDIMIHGNSVSIGCIAIGDRAIAELFHLAAVTKYQKWKLLLAPSDLRSERAPEDVVKRLPWMVDVYNELKTEMNKLSG